MRGDPSASGEAGRLTRDLTRSWEANAAAWTAAVREGRIASRRAGTDDAIVAAVRRLRPRRVLDVGCGEGWLARALAADGCDVVGVDASARLVEAARIGGGGRFVVMPYAEIPARVAELGAAVDVVACNFALLGDDVARTLGALRSAAARGGALVVQTVHPCVACGDAPYVDGWRTETFAAFGGDGWAPMPWYFRTLASWAAAFRDAGWAAEAWEEPDDASGGRPLSLLVTARLADR